MRMSVQLRRLSAELRRLREGVGLSQTLAAQRVGAQQSTLRRIENGNNRPQRRTLTALLDLYGASDSERAELFDLWSQADRDGWVTRVELPGKYGAFVEFETDATREWDWGQIVPGLLQTETYARALIWTNTRTTEADKQTVLSTRLMRQERLRSGELELWAIFDEAALRRPMGRVTDMREQAEWLCEVCQLPNVTIQLLPFGAGPHVGTAGSFVVLDFHAPYPSMVYIEHVCGDLFLGDEDAVQDARTKFDLLRASALDPAKSVDLVHEIRKAM